MVVLLWGSCFLSYCFVNLPGEFPFSIRLLTFSNKFTKSSYRCIYLALNSKSYIFYVSLFLGIFPLDFLVCQYFRTFSLYMTMTAVYHTSSNAFHTLSYISCNKNHKILVQSKDSKQGEFQVSCTKSSFLYSLYMSQPEETWVKKIYNYLKTFRFPVFAPSLYCLMDSSRGEMGIFNPYSSDRNFSMVKQRRL